MPATYLKGGGDGVLLQQEHDVRDSLVFAVLLDVFGDEVQVLGIRVEAFHPTEHMVVIFVVSTGVKVVLDAGLADAHGGPVAVGCDVRSFHIIFLSGLSATQNLAGLDNFLSHLHSNLPIW